MFQRFRDLEKVEKRCNIGKKIYTTATKQLQWVGAMSANSINGCKPLF